MNRTRRVPIALALVLLLLAAAASTAAASDKNKNKNKKRVAMLEQQVQAIGNGRVQLEGSLAAVGIIDPATRRPQFRVIDRAGDARVMIDGRLVPFARNRQVRLRNVTGNFLVMGTKVIIEVRGISSVNASVIGSMRLRGRGTYAIVGGATGTWNNRRIKLGIRARNVRRPISTPRIPPPPPDPTPDPAPQPPAPAPAAPEPSTGTAPPPAPSTATPERAPAPSRPPAVSTPDAIGVVVPAI